MAQKCHLASAVPDRKVGRRQYRLNCHIYHMFTGFSATEVAPVVDWRLSTSRLIEARIAGRIALHPHLIDVRDDNCLCINSYRMDSAGDALFGRRCALQFADLHSRYRIFIEKTTRLFSAIYTSSNALDMMPRGGHA